METSCEQQLLFLNNFLQKTEDVFFPSPWGTMQEEGDAMREDEKTVSTLKVSKGNFGSFYIV